MYMGGPETLGDMSMSTPVVSPGDPAMCQEQVCVSGGATLRYLNPFDGVYLTVGDYRGPGARSFAIEGQGLITLRPRPRHHFF